MKRLRMVAGLLLAGYAASSFATEYSVSMQVTATVVNFCSVSTQNLNFYDFDPLNAIGPANGQTTATVTALCTDGTSYNIFLSTGLSGDYATRTMQSSTNPGTNPGQNPDLVSYNIYTDSNHTLIWGDNTESYASFTSTGPAKPFTAYGQIYSGQSALNADSYVDTITVTLTY